METPSVLILGGASDIGRACALRFAQAGWRVALAGRDPGALEREANDVETRTGRDVARLCLDILDTPSFPAFEARLDPFPDVVVCVIGLLGEQRKAEADEAHAALIIRSNFEGPALLLGRVGERFAARGRGVIVGISSVAGDRGRASNYVYGAAKAGFTAFLSGLRNRFGASGVRVVTVKPGFVRTRMTAGMKLPPLLTAEPQDVAEAIFRAAAVRPQDVVYVKPVWRWIMLAIRATPEFAFKRLRL